MPISRNYMILCSRLTLLGGSLKGPQVMNCRVALGSSSGISVLTIFPCLTSLVGPMNNEAREPSPCRFSVEMVSNYTVCSSSLIRCQGNIPRRSLSLLMTNPDTNEGSKIRVAIFIIPAMRVFFSYVRVDASKCF